MTSGASVWPMKMFAAAARLSLPLVRMRRCITQAVPRTMSCKNARAIKQRRHRRDKDDRGRNRDDEDEAVARPEFL